ncbi:MAG: anti-sigma factor family protein, partial [Opitutales bacterium]
MNCQRVQELFPDYQDGSLTPADAVELRAHVASCPACQREWSALQELTRKLDQLAVAPEPGPRLRENFYAMLETHQRAADAPSPFA